MLEEKKKDKEVKMQQIRLKIYKNELEHQQQFDNFCDVLTNFALFKGKTTGDEVADEKMVTGIFKGHFQIYRWPQPIPNLEYVTKSGHNLKNGAFQDLSKNEVLSFVVRIYCVKAYQIKPKDWSGKSDAYVVIKMGKQEINDRNNHVAKQINPIIGR